MMIDYCMWLYLLSVVCCYGSNTQHALPEASIAADHAIHSAIVAPRSNVRHQLATQCACLLYADDSCYFTCLFSMQYVRYWYDHYILILPVLEPSANNIVPESTVKECLRCLKHVYLAFCIEYLCCMN